MFRSSALRSAAVVVLISLVAPLSALALPASRTDSGSASGPASLWEWLAASWSALAPRLEAPWTPKADTVKPLPPSQNRTEVGCTVDPNGTPCQGGHP